eukprot:scaffold12306_cov109-Cylindrotheca_fusiformis.AAC.5
MGLLSSIVRDLECTPRDVKNVLELEACDVDSKSSPTIGKRIRKQTVGVVSWGELFSLDATTD